MSDLHTARVYLAESKHRGAQPFAFTLLDWACNARRRAMAGRQRDLFGFSPKARGKKLARYDWLVLPLAPQLHRYGPYALDLDVRAWEQRFGTQASYIDLLAGKTGINLWELAKGRA